MATLQIEDGNTHTDIQAINRKLSGLNVQIEQIPLKKYLVNPEMDKSLQNLFSQDILSLTQKQEILQALSPKYTTSNSIESSLWCELIVINPSSPHLYQFLAQGSRPHYHTNDEVLYLLTGECVLGFLHPDGFSIELMVQAQEYIKIPAGVRYWFSLTALLQLKAVRYLTTIARKVNVTH